MGLEEILKPFLQYGILGLVTVVALRWAWKKDQEAKATKEDCDKRLDAERARHESELKAASDRLISKSETWMEKYHDLARELKALVNVLRRPSDG